MNGLWVLFGSMLFDDAEKKKKEERRKRRRLRQAFVAHLLLLLLFFLLFLSGRDLADAANTHTTHSPRFSSRLFPLDRVERKKKEGRKK